MNKITKILALCAFLFALPPWANGHEGHDHAEPKADNKGAPQPYSRTAVSARNEAVLKYMPFPPGEKSEMHLYLADLPTNAPLAGLEVSVQAQEDRALPIAVHAEEPGVYHLEAAFPEARAYHLIVKIPDGKGGFDVLILNDVVVGLSPEAEASGEDAHSHWPLYIGFPVAFAAGLLLMFLLMRGRNRRAAMILLPALIALPLGTHPGNLLAHGGDEHEPEGGGGGTMSGTFEVPKETQFLFGVLTQPVNPEAFQATLALYGTVMPAAGGQAQLYAPQTVRVRSVSARVGQQVRAGQTLAVLEPVNTNPDAVQIAAENGRLAAEIASAQAETNAAKKETERLQAIRDVAARHDVLDAEAAYQNALARLNGLKELAAPRVGAATDGVFELKSPISGTLGTFTWSVGSVLMVGQPLLTVTDLSKVYVEAQLYDSDAERVSPSSTFVVSCASHSHTSEGAKLLSVSPEVNASNQSQRMILALENPDGDFKIGEFVQVRVSTGIPVASLFVPNSAISEIGGRPVVFVKDAPETYSARYVALGANNGSETVVEKGLEGNMLVVREGTYQIKMIFLNQ